MALNLNEIQNSKLGEFGLIKDACYYNPAYAPHLNLATELPLSVSSLVVASGFLGTSFRGLSGSSGLNKTLAPPYSFITLCRVEVRPSSSIWPVFSFGGTYGGTTYGIYLSGFNFSFSARRGFGTLLTVNGPQPLNGRDYLLVGTLNAEATVCKFHVYDYLTKLYSVSSVSGTYNTVLYDDMITVYAGTNGSFADVRNYYNAIIDRELNTQEVLDLAYLPDSILNVKKRNLIMPPGFSSGPDIPTLSAADMYNVTATTGRPRVTITF